MLGSRHDVAGGIWPPSAARIQFTLICVDGIYYALFMSSTTLLESLPVRHKNELCCAPIAAPRLSQAQTQTLADRLKAIADPTRLRMLDLLVQQSEPMCVCDMTDQFSQNQPTISHHLKLLRDAKLVGTEKCGIWSYYWATDAGRETLSVIQSLT